MLPSPANARAERRAALVSVAAGVLLLCVKFTAYALTGSAAIFSDAMESIVNVLASGFALYAIILAHRPADREHPYGHGKVEFLAAGFEGGMILLAAIFIVWEAIDEWLRGTGIESLQTGILLMFLAMLANAALGLYLLRQGRRGGSITLEADGKHLLSDAFTSAIVLLSLGLLWLTGWSWIDPLAAVAVAIYIVIMAAGLIRRSAAGLMDEQDIADDRMIRQILDSHLSPAGKPPHICSYHKLRHRHSGRYHWVDFHIMVPSKLTIDAGHQIASSIEYEIEQAIGEGNATAHVEPCVDDGCGSSASGHSPQQAEA